MTKEARIYDGTKTAPSITGAGKTGQLHGCCSLDKGKALRNFELLHYKKYVYFMWA